MADQKKSRYPKWQQMNADQAYKLSIAEFKGTTIQALQDIRSDISDMKQDQKIMRWISFGLGGAGGMLISVLSALGFKQHA